MNAKQMFLLGVIGFLGGVTLIVGFSALMALPVKLLWNGLMPTIFGLSKISFLQAWGLSVLSGFLFKSTTISK